MRAIVFCLPVVHRPHFGCAAWREQFDRELAARNATEPPPRTRPLLAIDNSAKRAADREYDRAMLRLRGAFEEPTT